MMRFLAEKKKTEWNKYFRNLKVIFWVSQTVNAIAPAKVVDS